MAMPGAPRRRSKVATGALRAVGQFVAERRIMLALTQADLADLASVGVSSVRSLEAGKTTITLDVALRILDALGLAAAIGPTPTLRSIEETVLLSPPSEPQ